MIRGGVYLFDILQHIIQDISWNVNVETFFSFLLYFDACVGRSFFCMCYARKFRTGFVLYVYINFSWLFYPLHTLQTSKFYYIHKMGNTNIWRERFFLLLFSSYRGLRTFFNEVEILKCLDVLRRIL